MLPQTRRSVAILQFQARAEGAAGEDGFLFKAEANLGTNAATFGIAQEILRLGFD